MNKVARIYCGGRSDVHANVGDVVYEPVSGTLYELTSTPGALWTNDPRGNYRRAEVKEADADPSDLSEREFDKLYVAAVE